MKSLVNDAVFWAAIQCGGCGGIGIAIRQTIADALREGTQLRRPGKQEDVVGIAVYFASGASAYQNGTTVVLDGEPSTQK